MKKRTYTTSEAARLIGISKPTLLYWFKVRRVKDVERNYNGWRVFTDEDIERLKAFRERGRPRRAATAPTQGVGAERRHWMRVKAELPVRYEFRGNGASVAVEGRSETLDISLGGVMFGADLPVLPLGQVSLEINLARSNGAVATSGEVRWSRRWNGNNLLGVEFVDLQDAHRRLIGDYIGEYLSAQS